MSILDADSSQRIAIDSARQGHSFVLDGPPGTGKSQTIANIICELMAKRKNVLFVSEKMAALEVVYNRLAASGLSEFVLQLHSHNATRKEVAHSLGRSFHSRVKMIPAMSQGELVTAEKRRTELTEWAAAMNEVRQPLGMSLLNAIGTAAGYHSERAVPRAQCVTAELTADVRTSLLDFARSLSRAWGPVTRKDGFFWDSPSFDSFDFETKLASERKAHAAVDSFIRRLAFHTSLAKKLTLSVPERLADLKTLENVVDLIGARVQVPSHWLTEQHLDDIESMIVELRELSSRLDVARRQLREQSSGKGISLSPKLYDAMRLQMDGISSSSAAWRPADSIQVQSLKRRAEFLKQYSGRLEKIKILVSQIVSTFASEPIRVALKEISSLIALAKDCDAISKPERTWFNQVRLDEIDDMVRTIKPLLEEHRIAAASADVAFARTILLLDLGAIVDRFVRKYGHFRWLRPQFWRDRSTLLPHCKARRLRRTERNALATALRLKMLEQKFDKITNSAAGILGKHWKRESSSPEEIMSAKEIAKRGCAWFSKGFDIARIRSVLCAADDHGQSVISEQALDLEDELRRLEQRMADACPEQYDPVMEAEIDSLRELFPELAKWFEELSESVDIANTTCGANFSLEAATHVCLARKEYAACVDALESRGAQDKRALGLFYHAEETNWDACLAAIGWARKVQDALHGPIGQQSAAAMLTLPDCSTESAAHRDEFRSAIESISSMLMPTSSIRSRLAHAESLGEVSRILLGLKETVADAEEALAHRRLLGDAKRLGIEGLVAYFVSEAISQEEIPALTDRSVLETWIELVSKEDQRLQNWHFDERSRFLDEYRKLDRRLISTAASAVIGVSNARRPKGIAPNSSSSIINREAEKQKRHMPIRTLMEKAGAVIQDLKPCFMMSPLSVSQFLPPTMAFNAVIFDEASQVRPSDAINCIYRGRQLIVAGDQNQLPPTSFFEQDQGDDPLEYEESEPDRFESILDLCRATGAFQNISLMWHYRSRHEHLILFSNASFYGNKLITFPGAQGVSPNLGVEFFQVPNGVYRRGGMRDNLVEANYVCERVLYHLQHHPELSIGIVALSEAQASAIERQLDQNFVCFS